jgi:hypothetical protein
MKLISPSLVLSLQTYLVQQPYRDVAPLVEQLASLPDMPPPRQREQPAAEPAAAPGQQPQ